MNPSSVNRSTTDFVVADDALRSASNDVSQGQHRRERKSSAYLDERAKNFQANYEESVTKLNRYYKQGTSYKLAVGSQDGLMCRDGV